MRKDAEQIEVPDKAVNLFWCKGYNGTSMQEVAAWKSMVEWLFVGQ